MLTGLWTGARETIGKGCGKTTGWTAQGSGSIQLGRDKEVSKKVGKYNHFPITLPSVETVGRMSAKKAALLCRSVVEVIPDRIGHLATLTDVSWVYDASVMNGNHAGVRQFVNWLKEQHIWKANAPGESSEKLVILNPRKAALLKPLASMPTEESKWRLTDAGSSIQTDLGIVLGEYVRVRFPWTSWTVDDNKQSFFHNLPCVGWFGGRINESVDLIQYPGTCLSLLRKNPESGESDFKYTLEYLASIASTIGTRTKWTR